MQRPGQVWRSGSYALENLVNGVRAVELKAANKRFKAPAFETPRPTVAM
ncbi:MAG TPA: hypothetical protein VFX15_09865 [Actinomycetes bacterium]|nr:hypothetical protein [Actinomycetes bacterium]